MDNEFRKSSYSSNAAQCVEAGARSGDVLVRDTTDRAGVTLSVSAGAWTRFLATI